MKNWDLKKSLELLSWTAFPDNPRKKRDFKILPILFEAPIVLSKNVRLR